MKEDIEKSLSILKKGGTLLYPTDTVWGIGCDATNTNAVKKIIKIKRRTDKKNMIIIIHDISKLSQYVEDIPETTWDLIGEFDTPTTVIYPKAKNIVKNLAAKDGSIAIRIIQNPFCKELLAAFGKPIVSSSANISGEKTPLSFSEISNEIKNNVDYIVKHRQDMLEQLKSSTLIKLKKDGQYEIIRD